MGGGRGFLAPHRMLGSPSPALWPGPSPPSLLTPVPTPACGRPGSLPPLPPALAAHASHCPCPHPDWISSELGCHPEQWLLWVVFHFSVSGVSYSPIPPPISHRSAAGMTLLPGWSLVGLGSTSSGLCWPHTVSCSPAVYNKTESNHFGHWAEFITARGTEGLRLHFNTQQITVLYARESPSEHFCTIDATSQPF